MLRDFIRACSRSYRLGGRLETNFRWLIPFFLGVSASTIDGHTRSYAVHITPFLEVMLNLPVKPKPE